MVAPAVKVEDLVKRYPTASRSTGSVLRSRAASRQRYSAATAPARRRPLSILLGLLLPTVGSVQVLGEDMLRHRYRVLPRMNFSSPFVDLPHRLTVRQNLLIYARLYGILRSRERIEASPTDLQISGFLERPAGKLSAGQKTRVALAKALLKRTGIAAARRADSLARPRYRRLGAQLSRRRIGAHRRHDPDGLAQYGRGRAAVLAT